MAARSNVVGFPLVEGRSSGGPRHYLDGVPVHAGSGMYLLTELGWMPGRYEWGYEAGTPGRFYFALPGSDYQVSVAIPPGAQLAWSIDEP